MFKEVIQVKKVVSVLLAAGIIATTGAFAENAGVSSPAASPVASPVAGAVSSIIDFADGGFGQDVYVSREQLAAFLYREVQHQGGGFTGMWYFPLNYPDIEELGAFADEAMHWCVMTGVLQGTADGRLAPKATADRAQLSAILHRYLTVEK